MKYCKYEEIIIWWQPHIKIKLTFRNDHFIICFFDSNLLLFSFYNNVEELCKCYYLRGGQIKRSCGSGKIKTLLTPGFDCISSFDYKIIAAAGKYTCKIVSCLSMCID